MARYKSSKEDHAPTTTYNQSSKQKRMTVVTLQSTFDLWFLPSVVVSRCASVAGGYFVTGNAVTLKVIPV